MFFSHLERTPQSSVERSIPAYSAAKTLLRLDRLRPLERGHDREVVRVADILVIDYCLVLVIPSIAAGLSAIGILDHYSCILLILGNTLIEMLHIIFVRSSFQLHLRTRNIDVPNLVNNLTALIISTYNVIARISGKCELRHL